ncbi:GroES-like protein [Microthyrium microscopicum]|uniref:GroES-like protein n=1 Tax=Microthyrium microscopicum TaxID=703497 RepID=A0A6A6TZS2_9PEZI|nr:GroES-like protein [Microthyrium microscopicum]
MSLQSAVAVTEVGQPVAKVTIPRPEESKLADHELLLKVTVAGMSPFDAKIRDWNPFGLPFPIVLGVDVVGVVIKNGSNMNFPIGSHVFVQKLGSIQEFAVVDGRYAAIVPEGITDAEAALYPINAVTSAKVLFTSEGLGFPLPGTAEAASFDFSAQHIVILGGGTNCGKLAIQFARLAGIGRIVVTASASSGPLLRDLGATCVVDRQSANIEEQIRAAIEGEIIHVFDAYGNVDLGVSLLSEKKKGTLIDIIQGKVSAEVLEKKKAKFDHRFLQGYLDQSRGDQAFQLQGHRRHGL